LGPFGFFWVLLGKSTHPYFARYLYGRISESNITRPSCVFYRSLCIRYYLLLKSCTLQ
jgi:hypothetical protein